MPLSQCGQISQSRLQQPGLRGGALRGNPCACWSLHELLCLLGPACARAFACTAAASASCQACAAHLDDSLSARLEQAGDGLHVGAQVLLADSLHHLAADHLHAGRVRV